MRQLEIQVKRLNQLMGTPVELQAGNYHIDNAYGGVALHQMAPTGSGTRDVFNNGYMPKRELFGLIAAYIDGIQAERDRVDAL